MTNIQAETPREVYNILLLGDTRSGKTRFFNELCDVGNTKESPIKGDYKYEITTNIDLCSFTYNIRGRDLRIQLWDTPGSSAFQQIIARFMMKPFYMIIIMFNSNTLHKIPNWLDFISELHLSYTPIILLMENDSHVSHKQSPDRIIAKYPYLKYSINMYGQSTYILKTIIEELIFDKNDTIPICCKDRKNNRCCF
jgi:GTPase SAR1 family protein